MKKNEFEDITGQKFNRLTAIKRVGVVEVAESKGKKLIRRRGLWLFKCDCGNEVKSSISSVKIGGRKSCGCLRRELSKKIINRGKIMGIHVGLLYMLLIRDLLKRGATNLISQEMNFLI